MVCDGYHVAQLMPGAPLRCLCLGCAERVVQILKPYGRHPFGKVHDFWSSTDQQQTDHKTPCQVCRVERQHHPYWCASCEVEVPRRSDEHDCIVYLKAQLQAARVTARGTVVGVAVALRSESQTASSLVCDCGDTLADHDKGGACTNDRFDRACPCKCFRITPIGASCQCGTPPGDHPRHRP